MDGKWIYHHPKIIRQGTEYHGFKNRVGITFSLNTVYLCCNKVGGGG